MFKTTRFRKVVYLLAFSFSLAGGFLSQAPTVDSFLPSIRSQQRSRLFSGFGVATNYTWKEEAFEIEVTVRVPDHITSKNIRFGATPRSIALNYSETEDTSSTTVVLLDPTRPLRGRVNLDSTYWMMGDPSVNNTRLVVVTIEKYIRTPDSDFDPVDLDWKGVYRDDEQEVSVRHYDKAEPLDVRDYAGRMGVDIDNMDMAMVDKTMFSSGLNMSESTLNEMRNSGLVAEDAITRQKDGKEFLMDEESGESVPYSLENEMLAKRKVTTAAEPTKQIHRQIRNFTRAAFAQDAAISPPSPYKSGDPISELSLEKLREILKAQGLSDDGDVEELRQRLRLQVNSILQNGRGV